MSFDLSSYDDGFDDGVRYVLTKARELASPDDWNVPSVYVDTLIEEVEQDTRHTTAWRQCRKCQVDFIPTIETPNICRDCTRRSYK